jgi:hypothetical protein
MIWCERIGESGEQKTTLPPFWTSRKRDQRNPERSQNQRCGFQIELKESKTPDDEHCLDPPGAELLAWL